MDKWSTKPADHNVNRVRNNQRRHRARVKSRMEELEARLEETNAKLEAALTTISSLTAEVDTLRAGQSSILPPAPSSTEPLARHVQLDVGDSTLVYASADSAPVPTPAIVSNDNNCDCQGAPPPAPGESTMSCSSAFQIIAQQNFSGVEVTTIRAWLGPGYRLKPGEACRVETNKLYEILDHITSPS